MFFVFKLVVILLLDVRGSKVFLPVLSSWSESRESLLSWHLKQYRVGVVKRALIRSQDLSGRTTSLINSLSETWASVLLSRHPFPDLQNDELQLRLVSL